MNCEATHCPECGEELGFRDEIYTFEGSDTVIGCSLCVSRHNAAEWYANLDTWMADGPYL